ncbi:unnamed protein product [Cuscuta epithymum]|uniref:Uncharacterized protein n=1 Tax=Cuscuta epithymum TaxID=186058 RepID=A0AAV0CF26_9ASTE|nr:unnamed protein product [Cuscuta epithymum]
MQGYGAPPALSSWQMAPPNYAPRGPQAPGFQGTILSNSGRVIVNINALFACVTHPTFVGFPLVENSFQSPHHP